jgi:hypothetical protein
LQQEWQFLQCLTKGLGLEFEGIVQALQWDFLPALFGDDLVDDDYPRQLAYLPVRRVGLAILDPTVSTESNWTASTVIFSHIIAAIQGTTAEFRSADHSANVATGKVETQEQNLSKLQAKLEVILENL